MSLLLALAAVTATTAPPPAVAREIVVIGRKMKAWKGKVAKRDGRIVCRTTKSTKDVEIDALRCEAMVACTTPIDGEMARIVNDGNLPMSERRKRMNALIQTTLPCMEQRDDANMRALAERRARA